MTDTSSICYWRELWRLTSGFNDSTSNGLVEKKLENVQDQLEKGLCFFSPSSPDSLSKILLKHDKFPKVLKFIEKLQQFMDLDSFQTWDIFCHYLSNQFHGTVENALKNFSFYDVMTNDLLFDVWTFYNSERLFMLKQIKLIVESKTNVNHPYREEFDNIMKKINMDKLKSSLIKQFNYLIDENPPTKSKNGDMVTFEMQKKWMERNLHEQAEILSIILIVINEKALYVQEYKKLFSLFKSHNFGRQPTYFKYLNDSHNMAITKIVYAEVAIFYKLISDAKGPTISAIILNIKDEVEGELIRLQHNEEHGAFLLAWMILLLQDSMAEDLFISRYQHFGTKALQLKVFEFLYNLITHPMFSDTCQCGVILRCSIYEILCTLCNRFDSDGSMALQPFVIELCNELLSTDMLARAFWKSIDKQDNIGVVSLWNTALEYFPYDFKTLSKFITGLSNASPESFKFLLKELNSLPMYTEKYKQRMVTFSHVMNNEDSVILTEDFYPYGDKDFAIKARTQASIMDRRNATLIHFRTTVDFWKILNSEIRTLIDQSLRSTIDFSYEIERILWGVNALNTVLKHVHPNDAIFNSLVGPCEAVFDLLVRFSHLKMPYVSLIGACLDVSTTLIPHFTNKIFVRLMNIKLLPYVDNVHLSVDQYVNGESLQTSLIGYYLVNVEQPNGDYYVFNSYLDVIIAFYDCDYNNEIALGVLLPALLFILREIFPHMFGWYYKSLQAKHTIHFKCIKFIFKILQLSPEQITCTVDQLLNKICLHSLLNFENGMTLLKLVSLGEKNIQSLMEEETNWVNGPGIEQIKMVQMSMSALMQVLRLKHLVKDKTSLSPLEHMIYTQPKQKDTLKIVPIVTGYMNHVFNKQLPNTACRLLRRFALESHVSLLVCLDMSPHQIRIMFLERLRDETESIDLKTVILEFVATCVENQPGLTEVFFKVSHPQDESRMFTKESNNETTEGILTYMADYLSAVKNNISSLYSPLLGRIMSLFHALWKNNMQMLVKDLRQNPDFWEYLCSPLFHKILPDIKAYSQIYNMMGIELFLFEGKVDKSLQNALEKLLGCNDIHLKKWMDYILSFNGKEMGEESIDETPGWLSLLTSWKDFIMIIIKHLPTAIHAENKYTMASLCLDALNKELNSMNDNRTVIILAELYAIYFTNWKEDCFDDGQKYIQQIATLLNCTASNFDCLHHRAKNAILAISTLSIHILEDDLMKDEKGLSQKIIEAVCHINTLQLSKLYENQANPIEDKPSADIKDENKGKIIDHKSNSIMMGLKLLEQTIYVFKNEFHCFEHLFTSTYLINKLIYCTTETVQKYNKFNLTLTALNCLTAFARSSISQQLLYYNIGQNLWLKFLPPKELLDITSEQLPNHHWKVNDWWQVYRHGIEFVTAVLEKQGNYFSSDAIMFVGVQEEYLIESVLLIKQTLDMEALNLTNSILHFISELIKYEMKWKHEHEQSLKNLMQNISICLHYCIALVLRPRGIHLSIENPSLLQTTEESENTGPTPKVAATLNKIIELIHLSAVCLKAFSPDLLNLLTDPNFETLSWQPLMELQFGAPKLSADLYPQLTFGAVMSAICILTRSLNFNYHPEEIPLNIIKRHVGRKTLLRRRISGNDDGLRRRSFRSDSVTSISSTTSTTINPNWLAALDKRLVLLTLENVLTLLASQALLALKDPKILTRDKQIIRRELGAELPVFHDFVKKKVIDLSHVKNHLTRRKLGIFPLLTNDEESKNISNANVTMDAECESDENLYTPPPPPRKRISDSMRVSVVRKLHLDKTRTSIGDSNTSKEAAFQDQSPPSPSTSKGDSLSDSSKPSGSRTTKHVTWDEISLSPPEEIKMLGPEDTEYCLLSEVQMIEEDYLHFLSNIFLFICQTDH